MRQRFWDMDWFEDAVWRKDRLLSIQTHFVTAFLDRYVKGELDKDAYLNGLTVQSDAGRWPAHRLGGSRSIVRSARLDSVEGVSARPRGRHDIRVSARSLSTALARAGISA